MKRLALLLSFALAAGCGSAASRAQSRRAEVEAAALKTKIQRVLSDLQRPLRGKMWDSVEAYYYKDDPDAFRALKQRTQALWKRGQLLDLAFEVRKISR